MSRKIPTGRHLLNNSIEIRVMIEDDILINLIGVQFLGVLLCEFIFCCSRIILLEVIGLKYDKFGKLFTVMDGLAFIYFNT